MNDGHHGSVSYNEVTGGYQYADGTTLTFWEVSNYFWSKSSNYFTGQSASAVYEKMMDGFSIYHVTYKPGNINAYVFANGDLGTITANANGALNISNPYAGYMAGINASEGGGYDWGRADMIKYAGFMVGNTSNILTYWGKNHLYNELWHSTKTRGVATAFNKARWNNSMAIKWRNVQTAPLKGVRTAGKIAGVGAGGALVLADVALSGELKPSQGINLIMAGISWTGVGSVVAGVWFVADFGTMGVNYLLGNGAVGLGDMLDNATGTIEMYEGVY